MELLIYCFSNMRICRLLSLLCKSSVHDNFLHKQSFATINNHTADVDFPHPATFTQEMKEKEQHGMQNGRRVCV